ncbi:MAG TPA: FecR domain-containing protein [Puia sp.]|nr:FecR domain-containing protein [Puia sp.]
MGQEDKKAIWNLIAKKLADEASPEEIRELERLLKNNPELHYPMQTIIDMWNSSERPDRNEAELAFGRHLDRMKERNADFPEPAVDQQEHRFGRQSGSHSRRRDLIVTLSLTLGIGLIIALLWPSHRNPQPAPAPVVHQSVPIGNDIYTANGSRTHLTLPDGTLVWLNAGSRLTYGKNFNTTTREVNLTGEAFFDVAHNTQKPFLIHTTRIDVQVLGTRFNVKSYPSDRTTEATLIRGSIEVLIRDRPSEKIILRPDEKLVVANDTGILHRLSPGRYGAPGPGDPLVAIRKPTYEQKTGAIIETSWVDNKLIFREETFGDLASKMQRWYGVTIQFADPALEQLQFTGTFKEETIEQALDALKYTARFSYQTEGNLIIINK